MATKKAATKKTTTAKAAASSGAPRKSSAKSAAKAPATRTSTAKAAGRATSEAGSSRAAAKGAAAKAPARKASGKTAAAAAPARKTRAHAPVADRHGTQAAGASAAREGTTTARVGTTRTAAKRRTIRRSGITVPPLIVGTNEPYPFDFDFLAGQRQALLEERARYVEHAERFEAEADALARDREPGDVQFDDESGEGDSIAVERERDLALSAQARQAVEEIDAALKRLEEGTYGLSVVSGLPIPRERLEAIPEASLRVEEKSAGPWR